jgi:hypothetical protein
VAVGKPFDDYRFSGNRHDTAPLKLFHQLSYFVERSTLVLNRKDQASQPLNRIDLGLGHSTSPENSCDRQGRASI